MINPSETQERGEKMKGKTRLLLKSNILRRFGEEKCLESESWRHVQQMYGDFAAVTSFLIHVLFLRTIILSVMQSQSYSCISTHQHKTSLALPKFLNSLASTLELRLTLRKCPQFTYFTSNFDFQLYNKMSFFSWFTLKVLYAKSTFSCLLYINMCPLCAKRFWKFQEKRWSHFLSWSIYIKTCELIFWLV